MSDSLSKLQGRGSAVATNDGGRFKRALDYWNQVELLGQEVSLNKFKSDSSKGRFAEKVADDDFEYGETVSALAEMYVKQSKGTWAGLSRTDDDAKSSAPEWYALYFGELPVSLIAKRLIDGSWGDNTGNPDGISGLKADVFPLFEIVCSGGKIVKAGPTFSAWLCASYLDASSKGALSTEDYEACCSEYFKALMQKKEGGRNVKTAKGWADRSFIKFFGRDGKDAWEREGCSFDSVRLFFCSSKADALEWGPAKCSFFRRDIVWVKRHIAAVEPRIAGREETASSHRSSFVGKFMEPFKSLRSSRSGRPAEEQHGTFDLVRHYIDAGFMTEARLDARMDLLDRSAGEEELCDFYSKALFGGRTPAGRWPSRWELSLMQQVAVNLVAGESFKQRCKGSIRSEAAALDVADIFSVNGPPGTGKTTLLKDIVASFVVERAYWLARYAHPDDAFEAELFDDIRFYRLKDDRINDFGILVCSSNNSAVENISKELPLVDGMAKGLLGFEDDSPHRKEDLRKERGAVEGLEYFNEAARIQFGIGSDSDQGDMLLLSARLGNKENKASFCEALKEVHETMRGSETRAFSEKRDSFKRKYEEVCGLLNEHERRGAAGSGGAESARGHRCVSRDFVEGLLGDDSDARRRIQMENPSSTWEINRKRDELFLMALEFMREFVLSSHALKSNYAHLCKGWNGGCGRNDDRAKAFREHFCSLIQSLFLLTPVVSSTFSSIGRFFEDVRPEGDLGQKAPFGLLVVDEAGQAPPHVAIGALARCRRAIVVGDPKQVEPVVESYLDVLQNKWYGAVGPAFVREGTSVQVFADRQNNFGSSLGEADAGWYGCPLLVHRRCVSPMFDISNKVSYGGSMVQGTPDEKLVLNESGEMVCRYGRPSSCWVNVAGKEKGRKNHYVEKQGESAFALMKDSILKSKGAPSLFVISPFKAVADSFRRDLKKWVRTDPDLRDWREHLGEKDFDEYLQSNIGTVHTFQGKEADEVIFMLGCDSGSAGAVAWVGPNIVNVAASRAKKRLYVIGDIEVWKINPNVSAMKGVIDCQWLVEYEKFEKLERAFKESPTDELRKRLVEARARVMACIPSASSLPMKPIDARDRFGFDAGEDGSSEEFVVDMSNYLANTREKLNGIALSADASDGLWDEQAARDRFRSVPKDDLENICCLVKQGFLMRGVYNLFDMGSGDEQGLSGDMSICLLSFCKAAEILLRGGYLRLLKKANPGYRFDGKESKRELKNMKASDATLGVMGRVLKGNSVLLGELTRDERDEEWWRKFGNTVLNVSTTRNSVCHGSSDKRIDRSCYDRAMKDFFDEGIERKVGLLAEGKALSLLEAAVSDSRRVDDAQKAWKESCSRKAGREERPEESPCKAAAPAKEAAGGDAKTRSAAEGADGGRRRAPCRRNGRRE